MTSGSYDFTGYEVLVVGRHARRGAHHRVRLRRGGRVRDRHRHDDAARALRHRPVAVRLRVGQPGPAGVDRPPRRGDRPPRRPRARRLAATCPSACPPDEQAFIAEAARSGAARPDVPHHPAAAQARPEPGARRRLRGQHRRRTHVAGARPRTPEAAQAQLVESTARAGEQWAGPRRPGELRAAAHALGAPPPVRPRRRAGHGSRLPAARWCATQRVGDAVADAALFLASSAASRITGQTLRLG